MSHQLLFEFYFYLFIYLAHLTLGSCSKLTPFLYQTEDYKAMGCCLSFAQMPLVFAALAFT